jgi:hypothetical protein
MLFKRLGVLPAISYMLWLEPPKALTSRRGGGARRRWKTPRNHRHVAEAVEGAGGAHTRPGDRCTSRTLPKLGRPAGRLRAERGILIGKSAPGGGRAGPCRRATVHCDGGARRVERRPPTSGEPRRGAELVGEVWVGVAKSHRSRLAGRARDENVEGPCAIVRTPEAPVLVRRPTRRELPPWPAAVKKPGGARPRQPFLDGLSCAARKGSTRGRVVERTGRWETAIGAFRKQIEGAGYPRAPPKPV